MDSILRIASGEYIYILSDDDMVFENALILMKQLLDTNPNVVSVSGKYLSSGETEVGLNQNYDDSQVLLFKQNDFLDLANNFLVCDGHPFMRREIFQQYCMYNDKSFCLTPLFFKLISLGDILFIQQPVFQHFRNADSLTTSMTEHWFIDYVNADIEVALSDIMQLLPETAVETMRQHMLKIVYFQAVRMANLDNDYILMWHFLRRLKAIRGIDDTCLTKCESQFLLKLTIDRIQRITGDTETKIIFYQNTPLLQKLTHYISNNCKRENISLDLITFDSLEDISEHTESANKMMLLESYDKEFIHSANINNIISYTDLLMSFRLTSFPIGVNTNEGGIEIYFTDEAGINTINTPSSSFEKINSRYSN